MYSHDDLIIVFFSLKITDAVVRNVYYKYFHPKEALVSNGVLNRCVETVLILGSLMLTYDIVHATTLLTS